MKHPIIKILEKRKNGIPSGIVSFCTANEIVIEAILEYYIDSNEYVLIECTANQVNQYGGYSNMTPNDFKEYVFNIAKSVEFPKDKLILGADHFGPLAWADKPEKEAMENAKELVKLAVLSGFTKIHLDTSMFLGSDDTSKRLSDEIIAKRGAILYNVCEEAFAERLKNNPNSIHPVYVIGSEVPIPGGEFEEKNKLKVTNSQDFENTLKAYDMKFKEYGIKNAWENIIAIVVQPGVEFTNEEIYDYNRSQSKELCAKLKKYPNLVFEGHSTDYQNPIQLKKMVEDGIAILKVGPLLTFSLREGLSLLSLIEKEFINDEKQLANFNEMLEKVMLENPKYWKKYYHGNNFEKKIQRKYSFSDRSRYYMTKPEINDCINKLFDNINSLNLPLGTIKQFFPNAYIKIRTGEIERSAKNFIKTNIMKEISNYENSIKKQ